jgi:hypothetical protein
MTAVVTLLNQIDLILLQKNSKACRSSWQKTSHI